MSNIYHAFATLQTEIKNIAGKNKQLTLNIIELENKTIAQNHFVNDKLIKNQGLKPKLIPKDLASEEDNKKYTEGVMQALWNIAYCASSGYVYATYWYNKQITTSLDYLGQDWVPKIINEDTYRLGKALQAFLVTAQEDESINEIPILTGKRVAGKKLLEEANILLTKRLKVYELHTDEAKDNTLKFIETKKKQLKASNDIIAEFHQAQLNTENCINTSEVDFLEGYDAQEKKLRELEEAKDVFTEAAQTALTNYNDWSKVHASFPDSIEVSEFLLALSKKPIMKDKVITLWKELYNDANLTFISVNIKLDLTSDADKAKELITTTSTDITTRIDATIDQLKKKIADQKAFNTFEQELKALVITKPVLINADNPNDEVNYIPTNPQDYQNKLVNYQKELTNHKDKLQQALKSLETEHRFPALNNQEFAQYFETAIIQVKQGLGEAINATNATLASNKDKIRNNSRYLQELKVKVTAREDLSNEAMLAIEASDRVSKQLKVEYDRVNAACNLFMTDYKDKLKQIEDTFKEGENSLPRLEERLAVIRINIANKEREIQDLESHIQQRHTFLNEALTALKAYGEILDTHKGPYVPSAQIPYNQLISYLESTPEGIDELYTTESKGSAWFGLNQDNLYTHYLYYTSSTNLSNDGLIALKKCITDKISVINKEIAEEFLPSDEITVSGITLNMQQQALKVHVTNKDKLEADDKPLSELHERLTQEKKSYIDSLEKTKLEHENAVTLAKNAHELSEIELELAHVVDYWYRLEFTLNDIEFAQKRLDLIRKTMDEKSVEDASSYFNKMKRTIPLLKAEAMMGEKLGAKSGYNLLTDITSHLSTLETKLGAIIPVTESEKEMLENYCEQFSDLSKKKKEIADKITELVKNDPAYKALEEKIKTVLALEQLLIIQRAIEGENLEKIDELAQFIEIQKKALAEVKCSDKAGVHQQFLSVSTMIGTLSEKLVTAQLKRAKADLETLLSQFPAVATKPQQTKLLDDIDAFNAREKSIQYNEQGDNAFNASKVELEMRYNTLKLKEDLPEETEEEKKSRLYKEDLDALRRQYLTGGDEDVFTTYIQERALTHWVKDYLRSTIALYFGCFNYKPDAQLREEYINNSLKPAIRNYVNAKQDDKSTQYEALLGVIKTGKESFAPRAKEGKKGWGNSLAAKLAGLTTQLEKLHEYEEDQLKSTSSIAIQGL